MKARMRQSWAEVIGRHLIAWLLAAPLGVLFLRTAAPDLTIGSTSLMTAAALLCFSLLFWNRWCVLITLTLLSASLFVFRDPIRSSLQDLADYFVWAGLHITGWQPMNPAYETAFHLTVCAALSLGTWLTALRFRLPTLAFGLVAGIAGYAYYFGDAKILLWTVPSITAAYLVAAQVDGSKKRYPRPAGRHLPRPILSLTAIPLMFLLAITPVWLLPADTTKLRSYPFIGWIDRLTDRFSFEWGQGGSRDVFSISSFGFYPDGTTLGGTVSPSSQPVLSVVADRPSLLRGTIHDTYTGDRWLRNTEPEEHRLDPTRQVPPDSQRIAFDLHLPNETQWQPDAVEGVLYDTLPYQIRMLTNSGSSLFTPGRVLRVLPETDFDVLYDDTGELYAQRSLRVRDFYTVDSRVMRVDDPAFQVLTEQVLNPPVDRQPLSSASVTADTDPEYLTACLQLPDTVPASVRNTAFEIVNGARNPYEAVLRIESFFQTGFAYSLVVPDVPSDTDFVAWFLESRVGYCTYYATATAVLARAVGIPARYVEGFAMPAGGQPQEDGTFEYLVTGRQAHAWCEIYLNGVGWVAVDATPGYDYALPTPTPTPTATVTPRPRPTTQPSDPTPTLPPPVTADDDTSLARRVFFLLVFVGVGAALFSFAGIWYKKRVQWYKVSSVRLRAGGDAAVLPYYWRAVTGLLAKIGYQSETSDTSFGYLDRVAASDRFPQEGGLDHQLRWLADRHVAAVYGEEIPLSDDLSRAQGILATVLRLYVKKRGRFRYYLVDLPFGRLWPRRTSPPSRHST